MIPHSYQKEALDVIYKDLKKEEFVLLSAIMSSGKTAIASFLISRLKKETKMDFLILVNQEKLVNQFYETLVEMRNIEAEDVGICCATYKSWDIHRRITIASKQTFVNYVDQYPGCGFLCLDEVHNVHEDSNSEYGEIMRVLRDKKPKHRVLGLTATPFNYNGYIYGDRCKPGVKTLFRKMHHEITYKELFDAGEMVPLRGEICTEDSLYGELEKIPLQNGEYNNKEVTEVMVKEVHLQTAVMAAQKYCTSEHSSVAILTCSIVHAEKMRSVFEEAFPGEVAIVHSKQKGGDKEDNFRVWRAGEKRFIVSVNMLIEGFDHKPLSCIIMTAPIKSPTRYKQLLGRPLRTFPGKKEALIIDITCNTQEFGTDLDNIQVNIPKTREQKKKEKYEKICPECGTECHVALCVCACGYEWKTETILKAIKKLPELKTVYFESKRSQEESDSVIVGVDAEWHTVNGMTTCIHDSKSSGKRLGKATFTYSMLNRKIAMYFCFSDYYEGSGAINIGEEKWKYFSEDPYPENCEEFMDDLRDWMHTPTGILIDDSGEYPDILDFKFKDDRNDNDLVEQIERNKAERAVNDFFPNISWKQPSASGQDDDNKRSYFTYSGTISDDDVPF